MLAARAPARAPADAAALPEPSPLNFFRCILPRPPSGTDVFLLPFPPPFFRMGVLPGLGVSSTPSVIPTSTISSPPFSSLAPDTTLSGRLKTRGEGEPDTRPGLGLFPSGSSSFPFGWFLRFLFFDFLLEVASVCCCSSAFFSACLARTVEIEHQ